MFAQLTTDSPTPDRTRPEEFRSSPAPHYPVRPYALNRHTGPALSPREREVLLLLIEAMTDREIAFMLGISTRTVTTHVTNIYNKLGVFSRVAATTYAFRNGLV